LATAPTDSYWIIGDGVIYSLDCSSE
jgi:hypothetical protein